MDRFIAACLLFAIIIGVTTGTYRAMNKKEVNKANPITCSADKIMIVAKNGYFCVENAVQIQ